MVSDVKAQIQALKDQINHHDHLYYVLDKPQISDAAYDQLYQKLKQLEKTHPEYQTADSPTQRVGGKANSQLAKQEHQVAMLSLDSYRQTEDVFAFEKRLKKELAEDKLEFVAEPKFDGLSMELIYKNGVFEKAITRGDGVIGEDVTHNIKTIRSLPLTLKATTGLPAVLKVRAEVILPLDGFLKLNQNLLQQNETPFANPRNAASGSVRQLDPSIAAQRPLAIFVYDVLFAKPNPWQTHAEVLKALAGFGFKVYTDFLCTTEANQIITYFEKLALKRDTLNYEIDGLVIKLNSLAKREKLGVKAKSPRWAMALKFKPRQEVTQIENIFIQVGRQGTLTPVAMLKPVDVGGVTVSRASLHNLEIIQKRDIRVGDTVRVERSGDVIPSVVEVVDHPKVRAAPFVMPKNCPECSAHVVSEGAFYYCTAGLSCPAQLLWSIRHYASKGALNIDGLGHKTVAFLLKEKLISNLADLYRLQQEDLLGHEGFQLKKAQNLITAIQKSKKCPLDRFLFGLGMKHVGLSAAKLLANHFVSLEKVAFASLAEIEAIDGLGPISAQSVFEFFRDEKNLKTLSDLKNQGVEPFWEVKASDEKPKPFNNLRFVFTGELEGLTRSEAQKKVEALGGELTSSLSKKTNFLVVGQNPGSKFQKAQKLGIEILNKEQFLEKVEKG